jgi:hypothetical protein
MSALLVVTALTLTLCFGLAASRQSTGRAADFTIASQNSRLGSGWDAPEDKWPRLGSSSMASIDRGSPPIVSTASSTGNKGSGTILHVGSSVLIGHWRLTDDG